MCFHCPKTERDILGDACLSSPISTLRNLTSASALATSVLVNISGQEVPIASPFHPFSNTHTNAAYQSIVTTMPTYGPLRTTVSLYMWEADARQDISGLGDASSGCEVERIREDAFNDTTLDFLGPGSVPFYLVNAGQDLFSPTAAVNTGDAVTPATKSGRVNLPATIGTAESAGLALRSPFAGAPTNDTIEPDHESSLSSIDSSMFEPSPQETGIGSTASGIAEPGTIDTVTKRNNKPSKPRRLFVPPILTKNAIRKPITSPKALKLQIDLSKESFMHSIVTKTPEDICISVFYNGEFVYSRVFRWNTFNSGQKTEGGHPSVSGRRVGNTLEVPWILNPMPHGVANDYESQSMATAEARFAKINQNLLNEADEWGRDGKFDMFRNPLGEYLEALSETSIPKKAWLLGDSGVNIGVIDVIVGLGKSIIHPYKFLLEPQRKLTEGRCGLDNKLFVVPKELSQTSLSKMIASFQSEDNQDRTARTPKRARSAGTRPRVTSSRAAMTELPISSQLSVTNVPEAVCAGGHDGLFERSQSFQALAFNVPPSVSHLRNSEHVSEIGKTLDLPQPRVVQPPPTMSKLPKHVPQKRYRGPTPPPVEVAEISPVCHIEPPSHSTRSRTSVGSTSSPLSASTLATTIRGSQEPVDDVRKPPAQRQRIKSQREAGSTVPGPRRSLPGLDGTGDYYYETRSGSLSSMRGLTPPVRQLPCTEATQCYRNVDFGLDGTGDEPRSTKRKRASLEASSAEAPKTKVSSSRSKSRNVSSTSSKSQTAPNASVSTRSDPFPHVVISSGSHAPTDELNSTEQQTGIMTRKPRQRNPLSARELDSLLEPHKPTANAHTSFGNSFVEKGNSRTRQQIKPQSTSSSNPRLTARIENERMFIIKGLRFDEMPRERERVHSADKVAVVSPELPKTSTVRHIRDHIQSAAADRFPTPNSIGRILRSSKPLDTASPSIDASSTIHNDVLKTQRSAHNSPAQAVEAEQGIRKMGSVTDFKRLTEVVNSVPTREYMNNDVMEAVLSSTSKSFPNVSTPPAAKKENVRPSSTTSSATTSTYCKENRLHTPNKAIEVANINTTFETEAIKDLSINRQNGHDGMAGPGSSNNTENAITISAPSPGQLLPDKFIRQSGHSENNIRDTIAGPEARSSNNARSVTSNQKPSAKKPPVMKLKTKASSDTPTEPQTPNNRQSRAKPGLTIQPGLANAYRSYSETSTGLKTPTPRSGTFPTTQAPDPPRTRAATRAMQEVTDISAIAMAPMINFTPQKSNEESQTPSGRLLAEVLSSPAVPSPAPSIKETRILPSERLQHESPSSNRVLRSDIYTTTPNANRPIKTTHDLTSPEVSSTNSTARQLIPSPLEDSSPGEKITSELKVSRQRQRRDETNRPWRPTKLCQDSVLSYVDESNSAGVAGLKYDRSSENMCRTTKAEREGVFRTSGILMGVRYVMGLGSESTIKY
ncbi:hypothetical protein ONS96_005159 [Cadophora gregata f. sp. sojae]|nr:hypothetical protein ONS96_005159 [Cadophora gregata f. sp. sojae]